MAYNETPIIYRKVTMFAKLASAKTNSVQFVARHKVAITATAATITTAAVAWKVTESARENFNEFLDEKGLTDEFYSQI